MFLLIDLKLTALIGMIWVGISEDPMLLSHFAPSNLYTGVPKGLPSGISTAPAPLSPPKSPLSKLVPSPNNDKPVFDLLTVLIPYLPLATLTPLHTTKATNNRMLTCCTSARTSLIKAISTHHPDILVYLMTHARVLEDLMTDLSDCFRITLTMVLNTPNFDVRAAAIASSNAPSMAEGANGWMVVNAPASGSSGDAVPKPPRSASPSPAANTTTAAAAAPTSNAANTPASSSGGYFSGVTSRFFNSSGGETAEVTPTAGRRSVRNSMSSVVSNVRSLSPSPHPGVNANPAQDSTQSPAPPIAVQNNISKKGEGSFVVEDPRCWGLMNALNYCLLLADAITMKPQKPTIEKQRITNLRGTVCDQLTLFQGRFEDHFVNIFLTNCLHKTLLPATASSEVEITASYYVVQVLLDQILCYLSACGHAPLSSVSRRIVYRSVCLLAGRVVGTNAVQPVADGNVTDDSSAGHPLLHIIQQAMTAMSKKTALAALQLICSILKLPNIESSLLYVSYPSQLYASTEVEDIVDGVESVATPVLAPKEEEPVVQQPAAPIVKRAIFTIEDDESDEDYESENEADAPLVLMSLTEQHSPNSSTENLGKVLEHTKPVKSILSLGSMLLLAKVCKNIEKKEEDGVNVDISHHSNPFGGVTTGNPIKNQKTVFTNKTLVRLRCVVSATPVYQEPGCHATNGCRDTEQLMSKSQSPDILAALLQLIGRKLQLFPTFQYEEQVAVTTLISNVLLCVMGRVTQQCHVLAELNTVTGKEEANDGKTVDNAVESDVDDEQKANTGTDTNFEQDYTRVQADAENMLHLAMTSMAKIFYFVDKCWKEVHQSSFLAKVNNIPVKISAVKASMRGGMLNSVGSLGKPMLDQSNRRSSTGVPTGKSNTAGNATGFASFSGFGTAVNVPTPVTVTMGAQEQLAQQANRILQRETAQTKHLLGTVILIEELLHEVKNYLLLTRRVVTHMDDLSALFQSSTDAQYFNNEADSQFPLMVDMLMDMTAADTTDASIVSVRENALSTPSKSTSTAAETFETPTKTSSLYAASPGSRTPASRMKSSMMTPNSVLKDAFVDDEEVDYREEIQYFHTLKSPQVQKGIASEPLTVSGSPLPSHFAETLDVVKSEFLNEWNELEHQLSDF